MTVVERKLISTCPNDFGHALTGDFDEDGAEYCSGCDERVYAMTTAACPAEQLQGAPE